ncbi:uncharacterized protein LOC109826652 [Asparagus officinalis]|uniref:uncharacterized protein LOC109826652 n=1 Tax=Asparagus officinalis TaxID=4686 RepID=UPI00098DF73F|nr:uncharacterized protein LOC109826652 [Asparagus officinalis]
MHQLLPLAIRRVLPRPLTLVLLELSAIFRRLCGKKESEASFKHLEYRIALTVCYLEKMLPPSFFDITVHLLVHLAHEAAIAGPVQYRWMYPIERYLQTLKRYVRNKNYPEGSICIGYLADEALAFCSMYLSDIETRRTRRGRNADVSTPREGLSIFAYSGRCVGKATQVDLERSVWEQCRKYILFNCTEVYPFLEKRMAELRKIHRRKTVREVENLRNKEFPTWFQNHVNDLHAKGDSSVTEDLRRLANGPNMTVKQYKTCIVNGCRFRIKSVDDNHKNQNCGVFVSAQTSSYSSVRDNNPITGNVDYYGVLKNIYECDYGLPGEPEGHGCKVVLFDCDWVSNSGKKLDNYGFTLVNFKHLAHNNDTFITASQAVQVFYVCDPKDMDWNVAVKLSPRDFFDVMESDDGSSSMSNPLNSDDYYAVPNLDDRALDDEELQVRTDIRGTFVNKQLPLPVANDFVGNEEELGDDDEENEDDESEDSEEELN